MLTAGTFSVVVGVAPGELAAEFGRPRAPRQARLNLARGDVRQAADAPSARLLPAESDGGRILHGVEVFARPRPWAVAQGDSCSWLVRSPRLGGASE
jgi:hypothetical protein